ncbi:hypothetical protein PR003_g18177 [Phytophthora rubi]|uniref:Uncharacterized protein n=1 Tax=Phytophthora rubi TaxID=129364 RepID=A0A6A3KIX5_9STRA|nr:hypothetical protein PR001_g17369 [Phytophthora rubi]KAE9318671.1 hypothetical protein PR003_g18177 [Phytophthora rubi]
MSSGTGSVFFCCLFRSADFGASSISPHPSQTSSQKSNKYVMILLKKVTHMNHRYNFAIMAFLLDSYHSLICKQKNNII